ncbi:class I SAM-dependent methyltransferase [Pseudooceanicola sp. LIPI14-2-Ac024]|uniref:class I SAM-dependent methyltransferase n=1 Tax=Pseudooceanicola sp. LIPI14-2-Ac024 TaxID=3344875 RepID=UPI0035CFF0AA
MPAIEEDVSSHYTVDDLLGRIQSALREAGIDPLRARPEDLKAVDEFHIGGLQATDDLLDQLQITPETPVLDLGSGLGGTARHIAVSCGANVTGIDLTEAFVLTARELSRMVGLAGCTAFQQGSANDLPFTADSFELVTMFHVGMNIADKSVLMAEVFRVLAPGGIFALFDVMAVEADRPALDYPLPWAGDEAFSFVDRPETYRAAARAAGFVAMAERVRAQFAIDFVDEVMGRIEAEGVPPVGLHLLMRETAADKVRNFVAALRSGDVAPCEMIFRKPGG